MVQEITKEFKQHEATLNGISKTPFHQQRQEAMQRFERVGFPHKKHEEYRYLSLDTLEPFSITTPQIHTNISEIEPFLIPELKSNIVVIVDGIFEEKLSTIIDTNVQVYPLLSTPQNLLDTYFGQYHLEQSNPFASLNTAFAKDGACIYVPKSSVVEHPIQLIHINTGKSWVQPHHLIIAEENAQVKVIESYFSLTNRGLDNTFTKIVAQKHSIVEHYKIQVIEEEAMQIGHTYIQQYAQSVCTSHVYSLKGKLLRNNIHIDIEEEHAQANMYGVYLTDNNEVFDNHTLVNHKVAHCESNQLYKGVMNGASTAVFNGKIFVQRDAQVTNAFQSNRNIVLSEEATINTKPQLEIWADDVKCSHGCTIGKLNKDEIFYLKSRGINEEKAKAMLTYAFANEVLTSCTIPALRSFIELGISAKLGFEINE